MLKLSTLQTYLSQILELPELHTAVLLTPAGQLISYASDCSHSKEDVILIVGVSSGSFLEVKDQKNTTVEATGKPHLGHVYVHAICENEGCTEPLMLLALSYADGFDENIAKQKAQALAAHLAKSMSKYRDYLAPGRPLPSISSPTPVR